MSVRIDYPSICYRTFCFLKSLFFNIDKATSNKNKKFKTI